MGEVLARLCLDVLDRVGTGVLTKERACVVLRIAGVPQGEINLLFPPPDAIWLEAGQTAVSKP